MNEKMNVYAIKKPEDERVSYEQLEKKEQETKDIETTNDALKNLLRALDNLDPNTVINYLEKNLPDNK